MDLRPLTQGIFIYIYIYTDKGSTVIREKAGGKKERREERNVKT